MSVKCNHNGYATWTKPLLHLVCSDAPTNNALRCYVFRNKKLQHSPTTITRRFTTNQFRFSG